MLIFKCNFTDAKMINGIMKMPTFYKQMLIAFNDAKCISRECFCTNILRQPLWLNDFICVQSKRGKKLLMFEN